MSDDPTYGLSEDELRVAEAMSTNPGQYAAHKAAIARQHAANERGVRADPNPIGRYHWGEPGELVQQARDEFWWTVQHEAPEVLERLAELAEAGGSEAAWEWWGRTCHLEAPWCREYAEKTLEWWQDSPTGAGQPYPFLGGTSRSYPIPMDLDRIEGWDPGRETEPQFDARIRRYKGAVRRAARAGGWREVPVEVNAVHLAWFARYQVKGESRRAIHKADGVSPQAVSQAVASVAALIGLTPRD